MGKWLAGMPREIVVEILLRVPADSLVKSKRVSKLWYALITELIDDPAFVSVHLNNSKKQPSTSFVSSSSCAHADHSGTDCSIYTFSSVTVSNDGRFVGRIPSISEELNLPPAWHEFTDKLFLLNNACHCDGIVCIFQTPRLIFMLNPILRQYRIVPEFESDNFDGFGFGYDDRANDYKLVIVFVDGIQQSKVYSVNDDSWKVIEVPADLNFYLIVNPRAVYLSGTFYWFGDDKEYNRVILCFDVYDGEFRVMDVPEMVRYEEDEVDLTLWNDSVALYRSYYDCESENIACFFEIDVLDKDSGKNNGAPSWIKRVSAVPLKCTVSMLSFISNDELLMLDRDSRLFTFNVLTQEFRDVSVQDADRWHSWFCLHEKSLVSVKKRRNRNL